MNLRKITVLRVLMCLISSISIACDTKNIAKDNLFPELLLKTSKGDIVLELDRNRAPITVSNFLKYVELEKYKNTVFHRVEENFVIQGGGYDKDFNSIIECEKIYNESGNGLRNKKGTIAMARYDDPHSATSQFYFNLTDSPSLDPNAKNWGYTVFGEVIEGMEVLQEISKVKVGYSQKISSENVPIEPITITSISIR